MVSLYAAGQQLLGSHKSSEMPWAWAASPKIINLLKERFVVLNVFKHGEVLNFSFE